jgi:putative NAD(P)H nitroreductase
MEFSELVRARRSIRDYLDNAVIEDEELTALFSEVSQAPSAFNLQQWRFVVVRQTARKEVLKDLCYGQGQILGCSALVVVCGDLRAHEASETIYAHESEPIKRKFLPMIKSIYADNESFQRDEAIRGASLAGMCLMFSAANRGWDSGPMIGFDPAGVSKVLNLPEEIIPVMMVTIGKAKSVGEPRPFRLPVSEIVTLENYDGARIGIK